MPFSFRLIWLAAAAAGLLTGAAELVVVGSAADAGPGAGLLALGLDLLCGAALGLGAGMILPAALSRLPGDVRARLRDGETDARAAALALALGGALALLAALVAGFHLAVASGFARKQLAAIALGVVAALGAVLAGLAVPALADLFAHVTRRLPRPRLALVLGAAALGALGAALLVLGSMDWRALRGGPFLGVALLVGLGVVLALVLRPRAGAWALPAAAALTLAGTAGLAGSTSIAPAGARSVAEHGWLSSPLLALGRTLSDRDGDGFASRFGGGDCDDRDPETHPGAVDAPGDGKDQDCEDGDARAGAPPPERPQPDRPKPPPPGQARFSGNLLVITIDTLRTDRTGLGGSTEGLSPHIDALARSGVAFTRAHAHAPNTPRSFPSLLLSRPPSLVGWVNPNVNYPELKPGQRTFFDGLKAVGYRNVGIFSHHYFKPERGLHGAFDEWINDGAKTIKDSNEDIASPRIVPRVVERLKALRASGQRFALWTHLFEPHSKYVEHPEYPVRIGGLPGLVKKYDHEVKYVDVWVGKLLAALDEAGLAKDTAVVLFSDHGEAFGEHNNKYFHGEHLYEEVLRVPLVLRVPGVAPRVVEDLVGLADLGPTLLDLVGAAPEPTFRGRSLVPLMLGQELPAAPLVAELMPQTSFKEYHRVVIDGDWKLVHRATDNLWELYDLGKDPKEKQNLAAREPALVAELKKKLQAALTP